MKNQAGSYKEALEVMQLGSMHFKVILAGGLSFAADAAVTMILGVLSTWIQCDFKATALDTALMNSMLFLGTLIGCNLQGIMADVYGRRSTLILYMANLTISTIIFSLSPSMAWIIGTRFILGLFLEPFAIGYTVEFFPVQVRRFSLLTWLFWSIGTALAMGLSYIVTVISHWRTLAILLCVFPFIATRFFLLVPESPRYLYVKGRRAEALKVLCTLDNNIMSHIDQERFIKGGSDSDNDPTSSDLTTMFNKTFCFSTSILTLQWFAAGLLYIGITIISVTYIMILNFSHTSRKSFSCSYCTHLDQTYYIMQAVFAVGDGLGVLAVFCMLNRLGEKTTLVLSMAVPAITLPWLLLTTNETVAISIIFAAKIGIGGARAMALHVAAGIYPTRIRGTALALLSTPLFGGCAIAPFLAEVLIYDSMTGTILCFTLVSAIAAASAHLLPVDPSNKELEDY